MTSAAASASSSAPTASETAATLKGLLKRTRKHRVNERDDAARLDELRRTFASLAGRGELVLRGAAGGAGGASSAGGADPADEGGVKSKWNAYLKARHEEFLAQLSSAVASGRKSALRTYCGVVASTPRIESSNVRLVDERLLQNLIDSLINSGSSGSSGNGTNIVMEEAMLNLFDGEFLQPHRDVQYFALLAIKQLAGEIYSSNTSGREKKKIKGGARSDASAGSSSIGGQRAENLLRILLRIDIAVGDEDLNKDAGSFLIAPPPPREGGNGKDSNDNDDEEYDDDDDGEDNGSDDESSSESSSDDDNDEDGDSSIIGQKRKRNVNANANSKRSRSKQSNRPTWQQATKHRRALQEAWLAVLKIPSLPNRALKRALQHLPTAILPVVSAPLRFADVCTRSYEVGGVTSLLALHSLFVLMMDHGLEYPQFYASLYRLVTPRNFYAKHRTRFFRLLTNCLSKSDMLPAYVVAAFCKRMCRCALTAPPSGALFVLALVSNLLRRHGECACLVHRSGGTEDRFDADARDPAQARALESSLWELAALERHFHPAVAGLAKSVGSESDKTPMHDMDEFLLHTYKSLFETERKRMDPKSKRQKAVPVTFEKPKGLFTADDIFAGILSASGVTKSMFEQRANQAHL